MIGAAALPHVPAWAQAKGGELTFASSAPPKIATGKALDFFTKRATELAGAELKIKSFLGGTLYSEGTAVQAMRSGEIDLATISEGNIGAFTKQMFFLNLPYVFGSPAQMIKFLQEDSFAQDIVRNLEGEGIKVIAFIENGGFRVITNSKRPVATPADLHGLKLRTVDSPVDVAVTKAFGAAPTPVAWAETYSALSQGVVDGVHIPYGWNGIGRIFEVAKHVTEVRALLSVQMIVADVKRFKSFPPKVQQALMQAGREAEAEALRLSQDEVAHWKEEAVKGGVKIHTATPAEYEQWRTAGRSVWPMFASQVPQALLERLSRAA
ncbi:TRAP transporter substrate-binding protein [Ramlibacter sp.]|uniref:TRAP transporter substrate-binding protein n=1 Tax=Ramlibacter sp. TaxID=1917967 RepID=UPI002D7EA517|nr:TRAP transporter substrate-binding protein [Ramlibacter sp.]